MSNYISIASEALRLIKCGQTSNARRYVESLTHYPEGRVALEFMLSGQIDKAREVLEYGKAWNQK